ncbi:MAG: ComF family protein [Lachnospiraceae bacterium]|jgi:ComF family protein|nr:ComF family protein [Lachnospiraceae bacterium]
MRNYGEILGKELGKAYCHLIEKWQIDEIIPIPLHKERLRERGFNQAYIIAKEIGKITNLQIDTKSLVRNKATSRQKALHHLERIKNLSNAFSATCDMRHVKNVLLVDDIYTTGSTIDEAAKVLKNVGVEKVYYLTVSIGADD